MTRAASTPAAPEHLLADIVAARARLVAIDTQTAEHRRNLAELESARVKEAARLASLTATLKKTFADDDLYAWLASPIS